jgi:DNA helicase II / ATP-dependent DNA helicase PcrA
VSRPGGRRGPASYDQVLAGLVSAGDIAHAVGQPPPTAEQVAVIEAPPGPVLVVAGAGSGKTETMAARVIWLVVNGHTRPDQVLGLTFTRKAAGELADRVRRRLRRLVAVRLAPGLEEAAADPEISTYHAYAGRLVREHALRLGVEPESRLLTEAASWQYANDVVERWSGDMSDVPYSQSTVVDALLRISAECAEHLIELDDLERHLAELADCLEAMPTGASRTGGHPRSVVALLTAIRARRQIVPLVRAYADRKRAHEALDFGDQLALAARLTQQFPDIARSERARSRTVLLDEFQDTSHAQLVMLRSLFADGHSVTAVGDPNQAIYGWRGASAGSMRTFVAEFGAGEATTPAQLTLSTSWRNDRSILDVANRTAAPLEAAGLKFPVLVARPDAGPGAVMAGSWTTMLDEAAGVADWVAQRWLARSGPAMARSAAVLCRTRSQFVPIESALRAAGLPVEVVGLGGLLSTPEVVDIVSALQVVADPGRGDALMRLLTGPVCRLGPRDLRALSGWADHLARRARSGAASGPADAQPDTIDESSIVEALDDLPRPGWTDGQGGSLTDLARGRLTRLAAGLRRLRSLAGLPLAELVVEVERELGLDVELGARPGVTYATARAQVDALADVAAGFTATAEAPTLSGFLGWLAAAEVRERGLAPGQGDQDTADAEAAPVEGRPEDVEVSRDAVQVLTVHAAKGLEWDVVAIPGLVEGVLPYDVPRPRADEGQWVQGDDKSAGWRPISSGGVPYALRGDASALPELRLHVCADGRDAEAELADFERRMGGHAVAEERRLAYVAITRARHELLLGAHVWGTPVKTPRLPSRFLLEALGDPDLSQGPPEGVGPYGVQVRPGWVPVPPPEPDLENPLAADPAHQTWPVDPLGGRRPAVAAGAARVRAAQSAQSAAVTGASANGATAEPLTGEPSTWAEEIAILLAERDRARSAEVAVVLPTHLSASRLVRLAEDPQALAVDLRRPMPQPPAPEARRGTAFHAWVEQRFGAAAMVDVMELPGAADEGPADDDRLPELQANFLASEWAERVPSAVEVAIETPIAGTVVRGRIDAVFPVGAGYAQRWDVVDWKTGAEPHGAAAEARAVQLAAYRLAWARLQDVPVDNVGAAFFYAATGRTVRPVDLLDEAALERLVTGG